MGKSIAERLIGLEREEAYALGVRDGKKKRKPVGADLTRAELQDITSNMITTRSYKWCRARFLHALAGTCAAERRGEKSVLREVLDEMDIDEEVALKIETYLVDNRWIPS